MVDMDFIRIKRYKCLYCGCRNKRMYHLGVGDEIIGFMWTCCNCGHVDTFITNTKYIQYYNAGKTNIMKSECVNPEKCNNMECPLCDANCKNDGCKGHTTIAGKENGPDLSTNQNRKENSQKPIIKEIKPKKYL